MISPAEERVVMAFFAAPSPADCSYRGVAAGHGISAGTVYRHLRNVRLEHPAIYAALRLCRTRQRAARHTRASERRHERAERWFARKRHTAEIKALHLRNDSEAIHAYLIHEWSGCGECMCTRHGERGCFICA